MTGVATAIVGAAVIGGVASSRAAKASAKGAKDAAALQAEAGGDALIAEREARDRAQGFFEPFAGVAERGIEESSFLADPQAQFEFLRSNPLFTNALNLRDRDTAAAAAAGGRLQAGSTGLEFAGNFLQAASPLIDRQRQDVLSLLNLGENVAGSQANIETGFGTRSSNLLTDIGNVEAAGIASDARIRADRDIATGQGIQNALLTGATIFANRPPPTRA